MSDLNDLMNSGKDAAMGIATDATTTLIMIFFGVIGVLLAGVIIAFLIIRKRSQNADVIRIENLRKGTEEKSFSWDVFYQKMYLKYVHFPATKPYILKIRRRLEINNLEDEFATRQQSAQIITKALILIIPLTLIITLLTYKNIILLMTMFIFELFIVDAYTDGLVTKIDNQLLTQQADFFAQMRHSYHENNMVAEAIYSTAQESDHVEVSRQAEKIYEILNSADPENELEKYYDVAPNNFLREFAGISYFTQEFGDRKIGDTSIYLTNLENITQEMQLEILKRDKLDYVFKSLSIISIAPTILLEPLKQWAISNFSFTKAFYNGSKGLVVQVLIMIFTMICYILVRKVKDSGSTRIVQDVQNPWQEKVYNWPIVHKFLNMLIPKKNTQEHRKLERLLKDSGSKMKIKWIYVNKVTYSLAAFIFAMVLCIVAHRIEVHIIYNDPTTKYDLLGEDAKSMKKAQEKTERQNVILKIFKGRANVPLDEIEKAMRKNKVYKDFTDSAIEEEKKEISDKLKKLNTEHLKVFEVLISLFVGYIGYQAPNLLLFFQLKMRQMQMEDEVMSFQTIIMMLMKIERVDVEMILEWLERYADIFKEQIGRCLNNYESGAWQSLEEMKQEVTYQPFIRIIESMQTSVEKVPIREAFEELESDRDYYQDKRKETNERLIARKALIGKVIGFGPMVVTFVGFLIVPLVVIGMTSMMSTFESMSKMT